MPSSGVSKSSRSLAPEREQTSPSLGKKPGGTVILVGNQKTNTPKTKGQPWKKIPCLLRNSLHALTGNETKLWLCLALHTNGSNQAWPSRDFIRKECGLRPDLISRLRARLVRKGWIRCLERKPNRPPVYEVNYPDKTPSPTKRQATTRKTSGYPPTKRQATLTKHGRKVDTVSRVRKKKHEEAAASAFDTFWAAYPKKFAKPAAQRAWKKVKPSEVPAILASIEYHKKGEHWAAFGGQFIPYPATFLRNRRWEDEVTEAPYRKLAWSPSMEESESDEAGV